MGATHSNSNRKMEAEALPEATTTQETTITPVMLSSIRQESPPPSSPETSPQKIQYKTFLDILTTPFESKKKFEDRICEKLMTRSFLRKYITLNLFISEFFETHTIQEVLKHIIQAQRKKIAEPSSAFLEKYTIFTTQSIDSITLFEAWKNCLIETNNFIVFSRSLHLLNRNYSELLPDQEMKFNDFSSTLARHLTFENIHDVSEMSEIWASNVHIGLQKLALLKAEFHVSDEVIQLENIAQIILQFTQHVILSKSIRRSAEILNELSALLKPDPKTIMTFFINRFMMTEENIDLFFSELEMHFSFLDSSEFISSAINQLLEYLAKTGIPTNEQQKITLVNKFSLLVTKDESLKTMTIFVPDSESDSLVEEATVELFIESFHQTQEEQAQDAIKKEHMKKAFSKFHLNDGFFNTISATRGSTSSMQP